ncbi:MAG TPA: MBL fold metallo-hydrolase [Pyrinomonadaceae bacterium]|jgi:L-ascorbate metabolism protein UlaG (beta-lactamase superfamily)
MKKLLKIIGAILALIAIIFAIFILIDSNDRAVITKYVKNENLKTVRADWRGTPVDEKGRFVNHEHPFLPKMIDVVKWQLGARPLKEAKKADTSRLEVKDPAEFLQSERDGILWLGHASVFIRLGGVSILIDPVFGNPTFLTRFVEVPSPLGKIKRLDYVLVSHDHRDHCDEETVREIAKNFPNAKFLAGLGMEDLLNDWKTPENALETAGWFQEFTTDERVKIAFVPVRHWCRRGIFDTNKRLWGGFVISGAGRKIYFGGDSGFGSHYRETAEAFGAADYFIVGIGAYEPRWFMEPNHNNPADAFQAFLDSGAKTLVPMHYGTFDLSDEPPGEPLRLLKEEAEKRGLSEKLKPLAINEGFYF